MKLGTEVFLLGPLKAGRAQLVDIIPAGAQLPEETARRYFGDKGKREGMRPNVRVARMVFLRDSMDSHVIVPEPRLKKYTEEVHECYCH